MLDAFSSLSTHLKNKALSEANSLNFNMAPVDPQNVGLLVGVKTLFASYKPHIDLNLAGYVTDDDNIFVNRSLSGYDMIFTIAHELGMVLLKLNRNRVYSKQNCLNPFNRNQTEDDLLATYFAIHLLIPDNEVKWIQNAIKIDRKNGYFQSMQKYADCFVCKEHILLYRLNMYN